MRVKKTTYDVDNFAEYNEKSVQLYNAIHEYDDAGYSKRAIAKIVHCGRNTVTKYLDGDYESLCRKDFRSGMDQFYEHIISDCLPAPVEKTSTAICSRKVIRADRQRPMTI